MMLLLESYRQWPPPYPQGQQQFPIYHQLNPLDQFHKVAENLTLCENLELLSYRIFSDWVNNNLRRDKKYFIRIISKVNVKINLLKRDEFPFLCNSSLANKLHSDTSFNQNRFSKISDTNHQTELPVTHVYNCIS